MTKRKTLEEFIKDAKETHGDRYDYSKSVYISARIPTIIVCKNHGIFFQLPHEHTRGRGCLLCSKDSKIKSLDKFIRDAKKVHGDRYDYSKVNYIKALIKVIIICPIHGEFDQTPAGHLCGKGRRHCYGNARKTTEQFIEDARKAHGNLYDYSKTTYIDSKEPVTIICSVHGEFKQNPADHIYGKGCKWCAGNVLKTKDDFIKDAIMIHGNSYDYSKTCYINSSKDVEIICPIHGSFFQSPNCHLRGNGCKKCNSGGISPISQRWLDSFNNPNIRRDIDGFFINGRYYIPDGYDPTTNTVYEFFGDYWHGNLVVHAAEGINVHNKKTFGQLYQETIDRINTLQDYGFNVVYIWEHDFLQNEKLLKA